MTRRRKTEALKVFEANINRSEAFIRIFEGAEGRSRGQPSNDDKELLRGAVVFAIASIDAYLHDLIHEVVTEHGSTSDKLTDVLKELSKKEPRLALNMALATDLDGARGMFGDALEAWLSEQSFQGVGRALHVLSILALPSQGGLDTLTGDAALTEDLGRFTQVRHDIVHRARKPRLPRDRAIRCITVARTLVKAIDEGAIRKYWR